MLKGINNIIGKWNENKYEIIGRVGKGAVGEIYKVKDSEGNIRAIKVSLDVSSITREFNIMKELNVLEGVPRVYDLDDYYHKSKGITFYFFVMEYIEGNNLKEIIKKRSLRTNEIVGIGIIVLKAFKTFIDRGYTYTDIKLENILIDSINKKVVFIDFGGITNNEWGIREYTPAYNLLSWGVKMEYRAIESTIFGVTMLMVSLLLRRESNPLIDSISDIIRQIRNANIDIEIKRVLIKGLKVKYKGIDGFMDELKEVMRNIKTRRKERTMRLDAINIFFILSICIFVFVIAYGFTILHN